MTDTTTLPLQQKRYVSGLGIDFVIHRGVPLYNKHSSAKYYIKKLTLEPQTTILKRAKNMKDEIQPATDLIIETTELFEKALDSLVKKEIELADASKKASGSIRDSANKLSDGLLKIEKMADFNRLEKYVDLIERAAHAFNQLAELEKQGKLEKIASAIR